MHTCIHLHPRTHIHTYRAYITHKHASMQACMHACIHTILARSVRVSSWVRICIYIENTFYREHILQRTHIPFLHAYMQTDMHPCMYSRMYVCIHIISHWTSSGWPGAAGFCAFSGTHRWPYIQIYKPCTLSPRPLNPKPVKMHTISIVFQEMPLGKWVRGRNVKILCHIIQQYILNYVIYLARCHKYHFMRDSTPSGSTCSSASSWISGTTVTGKSCTDTVRASLACWRNLTDDTENTKNLPCK